MIVSNVDIGSGPGVGDGDSLYTAFDKVNHNFANVLSNVNSLTNSVTTVAGRTGNVVLTVNDIVGLSNAYAIASSTATANTAMRGYVDYTVAANIAALINGAPGALNTLEELAAALGNNASYAATITNSLANTNSNITIANTSMKGYVDGQISAANSAVILANSIQSQQIIAVSTTANLGIIGYIDQANTIQSAQVGAANLAIIAANLGMKGYVDSVATLSSYSNVNVKAYTESMGFQNFSNVNVAAYLAAQGVTGGSYSNVNVSAYLTTNYYLTSNTANLSTYAYASNVTTANTGIIGYINQANSIQSAQISAANIGIIGYIDQANTIQSAQVGAANLAITAANVGMRGYVDSQSFYSNAKVATYLQAGNISNVSLAGNVTATYFLGNGALLTGIVASSGGTNYSNVNVLAYLSSVGGNIIPTGNAVYSLGSIANQWQHLYVSSNTIYIGGNPVTVSNGSITVNGNVAGGNLTTYSGNIAGAALNLTGATGPIGNIAIINSGQGFTPLTFYAITGGSGSGSSIYYTLAYNPPFTINNGGSGYRVGDTIKIVNDITGNSYSNAFAVVTSLQNVAPPQITVGNSAYKFGSDGTFTLPTNSTVITSNISTPTAGNLSISSPVVVTGNISANYFVGNGSQLTGLPSSYSNIQVATYLPTYSGNIANVRLGSSGVLTFADGTTMTTAASGGGGNYGNANVTAYTVSMGFTNFSNVNVSALITTNGLTNYSNVNVSALITTNGLTNFSNVNVKAYTETMGFQNYGNVNVAAVITTNGLTNYSNVNTAAYLNSQGYNLYSNANVASYLPTYSGNISNVRLGPSGNITFADGTAQTSAYSNVNLIANLRVSSVTVGNLTVLGALNTTLDIGNSFVSLATNNIGNTNDIGFYGQYSAGQGNVFTGLAYVASDGMYRLFSNLTPEPSTTITLANIRYSNIQVGNILAANVTVNTVVASNVYVNGNIIAGNATVAGIVLTNNSIYSSQTAVDIQFGSLSATANIVMNRNVVHNRDINVIGNVAANNISILGNITGNINGYTIGYRDVPQITAANVTLIASDAGKHYYGSNTNPVTLTIPLNSSVAFGNGTAISIVNQGTGNITIANIAGVQLYLAGNATGGSRTLTSYGMATLLKVQVNTWFINGTGVV